MNQDPRGTIVRQGNFMRIDNALVEEVVCFNSSNGYLLISYAMPAPNQSVSIETLRLNIDRNTVTLNSFGQRMSPCRIRKGTWITAVFSSAMTRSLPPQSYAFLIVTQRDPQSPASSVTTGRIASVDPKNRFLYTGNPDDINTQTRFVVPDTAAITDRFGRHIRLSSLRPGQRVRITHANFQTASIPPQTTAFHVQLL